MNPVFIILVLLAVFVLWLLLSFLFKPAGKAVYKTASKIEEICSEEDEEDEKEDIRNEDAYEQKEKK